MCFHVVGFGIDPTYAPLADEFVQRCLLNSSPQWIVTHSLYRHRLDPAWLEIVLPDTPSTKSPACNPHLYLAATPVLHSFDPTNPNMDLPVPVEANSFYLGCLRDGMFALGINLGFSCAAPGWHGLESQPA